MAADLPVSELMQPLPNGLPAVSCYNEFRRITKQEDSGDLFQIWLIAAYTLMKPPAGRG